MILKDGFKSITVEPFNGYLDFQVPINPQETSGNIKLKGDIRLDLTKTVKVKSASLKFKGNSRICHQNAFETIDISTPILPKLKTQLFSSTTSLGPGEVTLPWEMEILNIYPSSVMIKRLSISYKIELTISLGLNRTVTAEYPIILKRHLLPCLQVAPLVVPKLYTKTISTKFHYEINAPRIVCVAQETMPMTIKLLTIGGQKRVLSIRTQLLQVELYRCSGLPKTDADMTKFKTQSLGQKGSGSTHGKKGEGNKYAKYTKRTAPAIIHTLDETQPMPTSQPLLIRHPLGEYLNMGLESPLAAIYHQLEITFQFGAKFEDIRAKIPIAIASAGPDMTIPASLKGANSSTSGNQQLPTALYPFEKIPVVEPISVTNENRRDPSIPNLRTPTPTSKSNHTATGDDEEDEDDGRILEIVDDFSGNNQIDSSQTPELPTTTDTLPLDSHCLRRSRSALDLASTPIGLTTEKLDIQQHTPSTSNKQVLAIVSDTSHAQSKRLLNNTEKAPGMWPRPGTQVPHQWRRRSSSQPYMSIDPSIKSTKDPKRHQPNLTITAPSMKTLRSLAQPPITLSKEDSFEAGTSHDDVSLIGASESSASSTSSASSLAAPESINSSNASSSHYEPQSRPTSPAFASAPGLPSFIPLHPQQPIPTALLEESFILSPSSSMASTSLLSPTRDRLHGALHYTQNNTLNHGLSSRSSVVSNAQSSVLDPDENMIRMMQAMELQYRNRMQQKQSLEDHYTHAKLPPLPTTLDLRKGRRQTTIYYADDSSDDNDDDDDRTSDLCNSNNEDNRRAFPPPITVSPLPPPPPLSQENDDAVCLCPKHGIVVPRR